MTQEVQPLTWSKRTNIEEHQQFFSKINEIIGNLAPTVDEAEQAIAQATAAIASANDAVATANAASAAASAAASQAQTAASTVAGYDGRLTAAEGDIGTNTADITALQGRMGTAEGNIAALQGVQADYVKKAGAAQTVTSQIMVPTTATGLRDTQIANGTRIQNDLDAYEAMVRDTGNKHIAGIKTFEKPATLALHESGSNNQNGWRKIFVSPSFATPNDNNACMFQLIANTGHYGIFTLFARSSSLNHLTKISGNMQVGNVKASIDANGEVAIWAYNYRTVGVVSLEAHSGNNTVTFADSGTAAIFNEPTTSDYAQVITATE